MQALPFSSLLLFHPRQSNHKTHLKKYESEKLDAVTMTRTNSSNHLPHRYITYIKIDSSE